MSYRPDGGTIYGELVKRLTHMPFTHTYMGSNPILVTNWCLSVVVITSPCHGEDHGFKSRRHRHFDINPSWCYIDTAGAKLPVMPWHRLNYECASFYLGLIIFSSQNKCLLYNNGAWPSLV